MKIKTAFHLVAALVLAAIALPGLAGNDKKQITLDMAVPPGQTSAPFTVTATITNVGNSNFNSFNISALSGVTIVGATTPNGTVQPVPPGGTSTINVTKASPVKSSVTVTLLVNSCGDGQWSAAAWTGAQLNGQTFNLVAPSTTSTSISCGPPLAADDAEFDVPDHLHPNCVTVHRGYYDKNGVHPAGALEIFVTNTVFTNNQIHFRWPDLAAQAGNDPFAAFEYDVCASDPLDPVHPLNPAPEPPDVSNVQVAWLNQDGSSASSPGTPAYLPAQLCNDYANFLPAPYATLVSAMSPASEGTSLQQITVNALTPLSPLDPHGTIQHPLPPFDIVIDTERMTVTDVFSDDGPGGDIASPEGLEDELGELACPGPCETENETWTVTRGVGHTTNPATPGLTDGHNAGVLAMSTPLPLLPSVVAAPYQGGRPALMCVADRFNEGSGHATTFIDIGGDGWGGHP